MAIAEPLARFALGLKLDAVPERTRALARAAILDSLACAIAAREERVTRAVRGMVLDRGGNGRATLWGSGESVAPAEAALVNGTAAHALDFDDVSWAMNGHPSVPLLPAAFAVAEATHATGPALLEAYVAGFEVQARLGQALGQGHYAKGWHPTSTLGVFGATAAAARLLGLDAAGLRAAWGMACSRASGSRSNFGTDTKPLHAGLAARAGVESAELARRGVTAHDDAFDADMGLADLYAGERPLALAPLGEPFALEDPGLELKPYPSCRFTHRIVDGVRDLREAFPDETPVSMRCETDPFARRILIHPHPADGLQAKFSLPYCAAVAWLDGRPDLKSFSDERAARDDVQALLREVDWRDAADAAEETVEIRFASGRVERTAVRHARGSPARPLDDEERATKVSSCVSLPLGATRGRELVDAVESLERIDDVTHLGRLCTPADPD